MTPRTYPVWFVIAMLITSLAFFTAAGMGVWS